MSNLSNDNSPLVGAVSRTVDQLQGNAHHAIDSAARSVAPAVQNASSGAHHAVDAIAGATNHAAASIGARGEQLHDVQVRMTETCLRQVREHPMATLGVAVALGAVLGWSLRSR